MTRWAAKYGPKKPPAAKTRASSSGNESAPAQWRSGIASTSGPRAQSASSMARRAPIRARRLPPGSPKIAVAATSAPITNPIRAGEPVVTSTNHGSASQVICEPVVETVSAHSNARSRPSRSISRLGGGRPDDVDVATHRDGAELDERPVVAAGLVRELDLRRE